MSISGRNDVWTALSCLPPPPSASNVAGTAQEAASQVITHGYGEETQRVAASAGDSMKQMGKAVGSTIHSASLTGMGEYAVVGALKEPERSASGDA